MKTADKIAQSRILDKIKLIRASGGQGNANETKEERKAAIERAKKDFPFMVQRYFPHYATFETPDFHIEYAKLVKKDKNFRGFCEWGRGLAKSVVCNTLLPFWLWLNDEKVYMVIIGTNQNKATQLLEDLRLEFENNAQIIADFGEQKKFGGWDEKLWQTKDGRFIGQSLGIGQNCRGLRVGPLRPNYICVDDIESKETIGNEKNQDTLVTWIERSLIPTMDGETRRFMQANNAFAPIMIQKKLQARHPKWKIHHVKAYDPITYKPRWYQKYGKNYYKEIEDDDILAAQSEYNQEPHTEGKYWKNEDIQWTSLPRIDHFECIVGHWDIAYAGNPKSDYNAIRIWGLKEKQFYYITGFVKKTKMKPAVEFMADYQKWLPDGVKILWRFESQFWNDAVKEVIEEVEEEKSIDLRLTQVNIPKGKKETRIISMYSFYQNNRCWYNEKMKSHNDTIVGNALLLGIEPGYSGHDDAPDADEQCITFLSKWIPPKSGTKPKSGRVERKHVY